MIRIERKALLGCLMFLLADVANAEILTLVRNAPAEAATSMAGPSCHLSPRALSDLFAEAGIKIADAADKTNVNDACRADVDGFISVVLNGNDYISKMPVDWFAGHQDNPEYVESALPKSANDALLALNKLADEYDVANVEAKAEDKMSDAERHAKHSRGSDAGAAVGGSSSWGLVGAIGGSLIGSLFDSRKGYEPPAGLLRLSVDISNQTAAGQPQLFKVVIYAASTAKERPFDLLRTAMKRAVAEIQTRPETENTASASAPAIQTREVH